MGNASSKKPNKSTIELRLNNFALNGPPAIPDKFNGRIDTRVWTELCTLCNDACSPPGVDEQRSQIKTLQCRLFSSIPAIVIGFFYGFLAGFLGAANGNTALWVSAIIVGAVGFIGGIAMMMTSSVQMQQLQQVFFMRIRDRLNLRMSALNAKYANMIQFHLRADALSQRNGRNGQSGAVVFKIDIELLVQHVEFVGATFGPFGDGSAAASVAQQPQHMQVVHAMRQPQAQLVPQQQPNNVIMVQMPDGRLVPAQVMGNGQGQPPPIIQQQQPQVIYASAPQMQQQQQQPNMVYASPPYNPSYDNVPEAAPFKPVPRVSAPPAYANPPADGGESGDQEGAPTSGRDQYE